jgi:hypothetical protein
VGFWATFKDFKCSTQVLLVLSLLLGLALLIGFSLTDANVNVTLGSWDPKPEWLKRFNYEWFQSHAYIPNIYAGFTGFLIGVPVAAVVLTTFTIQREDRAATDRVRSLTKAAWKQFRDAVEDLCGESRVKAMKTIAQQVQEHHDEVRKGFKTYEESEKTPDDFEKLKKFFTSQIKPWQEPFAQMMRAVGLEQSLTMSWHALLRDWNTLDQYVRMQRLERGLPWFDRDFDSLLQHRMNPAKHPMQPIFGMHEGPDLEYQWRAERMWDAFKSLYYFVDMNQENFSFITLASANYFPSSPVNGYMDAIEAAAKNMQELSSTVQAIADTDWLDRPPA